MNGAGGGEEYVAREKIPGVKVNAELMTRTKKHIPVSFTGDRVES